MRRTKAFTIVELIVVIAVVGILATISIISYNGWRTNTVTNQLISDLTNAAAAMERDRSFGEGYPTALPSDFNPSDGVSISYAGGDAKTFCIDGSIDGITYYVDNTTSSDPKEGTCASRPVTSVPSVSAAFNPATVSDAAADFSWTSAVDAASYEIQCSTDTIFVSGLITATGLTGTSGTITGLNALTSYYCRMRAVNVVGAGEWTATQAIATTALTPPSGSAAASITSTSMSWSYNAVSGANTYELQLSTSPTFASIESTATISGTSRSFTSLDPSTTYYFRVRVTTGGGTSNWSSAVSAATSTVGTPTGLTATSQTTSSISWSFNSVSGAASYDVQRMKTSACNTESATANITSTTPTSTSLVNGSIYCYRVRAVAPNGTPGSYTSYIQSNTTQPTVTGLSVSPATLTSISTSWSAVANTDMYDFDRLNGSCSAVEASASQAGTTRTSSGLTRGTTYCYRVRSVSPDGIVGGWSTTDTATTYTDTMPSGSSYVLSGSHRDILYSSNMAYRLALQTDGNLVIYRMSDGVPQWNKGAIGGNVNYRLSMQTDCNLVMYNPSNSAVWNVGTFGQPQPCYMVLQSDNKIVVYANGVARWWSN